MSVESLSRPHHNHNSNILTEAQLCLQTLHTHTRQLSEIDNGQSILGAEWAPCYTAHIATTVLSDLKEDKKDIYPP